MPSHSLSVLAGFVSCTILISSNLPMLFKAFKTEDLRSYSLGHLALGTLGNTVYWLYVLSLPFGPVWLLQEEVETKREEDRKSTRLNSSH